MKKKKKQMMMKDDDDDDDDVFNLLSVGVQGDYFTSSHSHTWYDSSGRVIGPSQRPVHNTTLIRDRRPYYRQESNPQSHQRSGRISTP